MQIAAMVVVVTVLEATALYAQTPTPSSDEKLNLDVEFIAGYGHDGAQAALGFEKQGRVGQATLTLSGKLHDRFRYRLSFNPVNEVPAKPACGEADFFFPNDPSLYSAGPLVPCDPEDGHKRVDTYNTFALDYIVQQGPLREGFVDWLANDAVTARFGRFILPIGFDPEEVGSWTSKDMTRIQRLNGEANFGAMVTFAKTVFEVSAMGVLGEGNRQKDYDWFYFADPTLDTNSGLTAVVSAWALPHRLVELRGAWKKGFTGSKVERLPSYWASKRNDDALVASAKVQPHRFVGVFAEYARYTWGPAESSAEMLGVDPEPIDKSGYYVGAQLAVPLRRNVVVGATFTREELSRDDSLIKYLAANNLYGVEMGKKDRGTILRVFVSLYEGVMAGLYWADVSNPYPWVSGSWPVAGAQAFTGRAPDRYGIAVTLRARLFP
jgi:hypothetical protein